MGDRYIKETSYCINCGKPTRMHELYCSDCKHGGVKARKTSGNEHQIAMLARRGRELGMSYGQYVAKMGDESIEYIPKKKTKKK